MTSNVWDVLVIGEGLAGVTAAAAAAKTGARVMLVSKGPGTFVLSDGSITLPPRNNPAAVGVAGADDQQRAGYDFFLKMAETAGCPFIGDLNSTMHLPTILGTYREVTFAPASVARAATSLPARVVIAGLSRSLSFDAKFLVRRFSSRAVAGNTRSRFLSTVLDIPCSGQITQEFEIASRFDRDPQFRSSVISALAKAARGTQLVIVPGMLGLNTTEEELRAFEQQVGADVCELATFPPSVLGVRLLRRMERYLQTLGVTLSTGFSVQEILMEGDHCSGVVLDTPGRPRVLHAHALVLASGANSQLLSPQRIAATPNLFLCGGALHAVSLKYENAIAIVSGYRAGCQAASMGVHCAR